MEVEESGEDLEHTGSESGGWYWGPGKEGVVMDDLEEIVFGVFEYHEDALAF